jgi:hypothetical protein
MNLPELPSVTSTLADALSAASLLTQMDGQIEQAREQLFAELNSVPSLLDQCHARLRGEMALAVWQAQRDLCRAVLSL